MYCISIQLCHLRPSPAISRLVPNSSSAISPSSEPSSRAKTTRAGPKYPAACTASSAMAGSSCGEHVGTKTKIY